MNRRHSEDLVELAVNGCDGSCALPVAAFRFVAVEHAHELDESNLDEGASDRIGHAGDAMKLHVTLERDESGMIVVECPAIPGCISQGRTEEEALANIREAMLACLEVRAEEGMPLTVRTVQIDVSVA